MNQPDVLWFFRKPRSLGNFSIEASFRTVLNNWCGDVMPRWVESNHYSDGFTSRLKIIRECSRLSASIIHITGDIHFAALAWPKWRRKRPFIVLTIHDLGFMEEYQGIKKWMMKILWITLPLQCVDHLIVVSESTMRAVESHAPGFEKCRISVIPSCITDAFKTRAERPSNKTPILLHVGTAENKNLGQHARAIAGIDAHLRIIGEPNEKQIQLLDELQINYSWKSKLTTDEVAQEYAASDMLLFVSTLEGFGMPILEAQRTGVPVITSIHPPMSQVAGSRALLANPQNHEAIRKHIQTLLNDEQTYADVVRDGCTNSERFTAVESAKKIMRIYQSSISNIEA